MNVGVDNSLTSYQYRKTGTFYKKDPTVPNGIHNYGDNAVNANYWPSLRMPTDTTTVADLVIIAAT